MRKFNLDHTFFVNFYQFYKIYIFVFLLRKYNVAVMFFKYSFQWISSKTKGWYHKYFTKQNSKKLLNIKVQTLLTRSLFGRSVLSAAGRLRLDVMTSNWVCCRSKWSLWCHNSQMICRSSPRFVSSLSACKMESVSSFSCKNLTMINIAKNNWSQTAAIIIVTKAIRSVESHIGAQGNILARPPKHVRGAPVENF